MHTRIYKELREVWQGIGPRSNEVVRITEDYMEFKEKQTYYSIRIWYRKAGEEQLRPTERGFTISPQELITLANALDSEKQLIENRLKQPIYKRITVDEKREGDSEAN